MENLGWYEAFYLWRCLCIVWCVRLTTFRGKKNQPHSIHMTRLMYFCSSRLSLYGWQKKMLAKGRIIQVNVKNYLCSCVSSQPTVLSLFFFPPLWDIEGTDLNSCQSNKRFGNNNFHKALHERGKIITCVRG